MTLQEIVLCVIAALLAIHVFIYVADYGCGRKLSEHVISRDECDAFEKRWRHGIDVDKYLAREDSLRLNIALMAMQGLLGNPNVPHELVVDMAFSQADAMLMAKDVAEVRNAH